MGQKISVYYPAAFGCLIAILIFGLTPTSLALAADARAIHERLLTLDTHLDTPSNFQRPGWDIMDRHEVFDNFSFVDYPRMIEGGLDGGFFVIYTQQGPRDTPGFVAARNAALIRAMEIREMVARNHAYFELALHANDAARINAAGRRVVFQSIENAYPLGNDLTLLQAFYDLGVRMVGPVHFSNNDFGDSSTDPSGPEWHGLSSLGRELVAEANRLGILLDASHASDAVLDQMIDLSATPIILSHTGCKAVWDHPRNVGDALLHKLAQSGGVIQMNAYSDYMIAVPENAEFETQMDVLQERYSPMRSLAGAELASYAADRRALEAKYPMPRASFDDFMEHLLYALALVGPDHVGIGLDLDGGGGVNGLEDAADAPRITEHLLSQGYLEEDIAKIWSGNVLRLLAEAETHATLEASKAHNPATD
jgi:membrane dipeptidase